MASEKETLIAPDLMVATLDEARRVLEVQRDELESLYRRTDGLVRLTVAAMAGLLAAVGLIGTSPTDFGWFHHAGLVAGTISLSGALMVFISVLTGFPRPIVPSYGPRIAKLVENLEQDEWDVHKQRLAILLSVDAASRRFEDIQDVLVRRQTQGIYTLALGGTVLLVTLALILGGSIIA